MSAWNMPPGVSTNDIPQDEADYEDLPEAAFFAPQMITEDCYSAAQMRAAIAGERERCANLCTQRSADYWHDYKDRASPFFCDARTEAMSDEAELCAIAILGTPNVKEEARP